MIEPHLGLGGGTDAGTDGLRKLAWVPIAATLLVFLAAYLIDKVGPQPHHVTTNPDVTALFAGDNGIDDRAFIVIAGVWWALCPLLIAVQFSLHHSGRLTGLFVRKAGQYVAAAAGVLAFVIILGTTTTGHSTGTGMPGYLQLFIGVAAVVVYLFCYRNSVSSVLRILNFLCIAAAVIAVLGSAIQIPHNLRDFGDTGVGLDEFWAAAAGHFAMYNYIPAYDRLLTLPMVVLTPLAKDHAIGVALLYTLALELTTWAAMIWGGLLAGGRRIWPLLTLVAIAPATVASMSDVTALVDNQNVTRAVLPVITIAVAVAVLRRNLPADARRSYAAIALVGFCGGVAALNNPEFGAPAIFATFIPVMALSASFKDAAWRAAAMTGGVLVLPLLWELGGVVSGNQAHWNYLLAMQRVYTERNNLPIPAFGPNIAVYAWFLSTAVVGTALLVKARGGERKKKAQAVYLCAAGWWSIFTISYWLNEPAWPILIGGYGFVFGLLASAWLPIIVDQFVAARLATHLRTHEIASGALALLVVGACASAPALAPTLSDAYGRLTSAGPDAWDVQKASIATALSSPAAAPLRRAERSKQLVQALFTPSITALQTGLPSVLLYPTPDLIRWSPYLTHLECDYLRTQTFKYILLPTDTVGLLHRWEGCRAKLDFAAPLTFPGNLSALPARQRSQTHSA